MSKIWLNTKDHPIHKQRTKKQNTYLEVCYLFKVLNHYADKHNSVGIRQHWEMNSYEDYMWKKHAECNQTDGSWSERRKGSMQVLKIETYLQSNLSIMNSRLLQTFGIFIEALRDFCNAINIYAGLH